MNNLVAIMLGAAVVSGSIYATKEDCKADKSLIEANAQLQNKLLALSEQSQKAYDNAAKALEDAKKNLSCPK